MVDEHYTDFSDVLALCCVSNESFRKYEVCLTVQVSKLHGHGAAVSLQESLFAIIFLSYFFVNYLKRIPILSATSGHLNITSEQSSDNIVFPVRY